VSGGSNDGAHHQEAETPAEEQVANGLAGQLLELLVVEFLHLEHLKLTQVIVLFAKLLVVCGSLHRRRRASPRTAWC
jgi:hypothetical protein